MSEVFSLDIEKLSLAGLIQYPEVYADIQGIVADDSYFHDVNRAIFQVGKLLISEGKELSAIMIAEKIKNLGISFKEDLNVFAYIDNLSLIQINEASVIDTFKELSKIKVRRDIWKDAKRLQKEMENCGNLPLDNIIGIADSIISERINAYDLENEPVDLYAGMEAHIEELGNNPVEEAGLIPPHKLYRDLYGGFIPGDLYFYVARAKAGKSTFLIDLMSKVANVCNPADKVFGLYLDTELETKRLMYRCISNLTGINEWYIRTGNWRKNERTTKSVRAAWKIIQPFFGSIDHLYVAGKPIEEIASIIRRWHHKKFRSRAALELEQKLQKKLKPIVCYDYMKLTGETLNEMNKEHQVIGQKVDRLKQTGSEIESPILSACQMNRSGEGRTADRITDDGTAIAMSDRLSWFASFVGIIRRKLLEEIADDGEEFGTHKMIPLFTRNQGKEAPGFFDLIKVIDDEGDERWRENFLNYEIKNFHVTERGSLKEIAAKKRMKFNIANGGPGELL